MSVALEQIDPGNWEKVRRGFQIISKNLRPPMPNARVFNSAAITLTTAVDTFLTFNSEHWDIGSVHSTAVNPGRLTAPITGLYMVGGSVDFVANAVGYRQLAIRHNGTTFIAVETRTGSALVATQISIATMYRFVAGEYVELRATQTSGGNLNVSAGGNFSPEFWMVRLGGYATEGLASGSI